MDAPKKPNRPPTLVRIVSNNEYARRFAVKLPVTALSMLAVLMLLRASLGAAMPVEFYAFAAIAAALLLLWWRWDHNATRLRDANALLPNFVLKDAGDLAWIEWVKWVEPRAANYLETHRPDGQYTSRDMLKLLAAKHAEEVDAGFRAPYNGDTERCADELDARRDRERAQRFARMAQPKS